MTSCAIQVTMNWKSYDGKLTTLEMRGEMSEVKKTVAKVSSGLASCVMCGWCYLCD